MQFKSFLRLLLLTCVLVVCCEGKGSGARSGGTNGTGGRSYGRNRPSAFLGQQPPNGNNPSSPTRGRSGGIISAWGIITLIMLIIVGSLGAYYFSIFYPLICAERGKYDVMEMSTV